MAEKEIGEVTHWYDKIAVAVVRLKDSIKVGDKIRIKGGGVEFDDMVTTMQVERVGVPKGEAGDEVAIKLTAKAKEGSQIFKIE